MDSAEQHIARNRASNSVIPASTLRHASQVLSLHFLVASQRIRQLARRAVIVVKALMLPSALCLTTTNNMNEWLARCKLIVDCRFMI